jgi:hypothetical protein
LEQLLERVATSSLSSLVAALLFLLSIAIGLGITFLNAVGKSALVDQIYRIEDSRRPSRAKSWEAGKAQARPVFLIILLLGLPVFLIVLVGMVAMLITARLISPSLPVPVGDLPAVGASLACLAPALCLGALLAVPLSVLRRLAVLACVLEARSPWESVTRGWEVLRDNLSPILGTWVTVLLVSLGVAVLVGTPCGALVLALRTSQWFTGEVSLGLALGSMLFFWLAGLVINSVLETFRTALWTLVYRQLMGMGRRGEEETSS